MMNLFDFAIFGIIAIVLGIGFLVAAVRFKNSADEEMTDEEWQEWLNERDSWR